MFFLTWLIIITLTLDHSKVTFGTKFSFAGHVLGQRDSTPFLDMSKAEMNYTQILSVNKKNIHCHYSYMNIKMLTLALYSLWIPRSDAWFFMH